MSQIIDHCHAEHHETCTTLVPFQHPKLEHLLELSVVFFCLKFWILCLNSISFIACMLIKLNCDQSFTVIRMTTSLHTMIHVNDFGKHEIGTAKH